MTDLGHFMPQSPNLLAGHFDLIEQGLGSGPTALGVAIPARLGKGQTTLQFPAHQDRKLPVRFGAKPG